MRRGGVYLLFVCPFCNCVCLLFRCLLVVCWFVRLLGSGFVLGTSNQKRAQNVSPNAGFQKREDFRLGKPWWDQSKAFVRALCPISASTVMSSHLNVDHRSCTCVCNSGTTIGSLLTNAFKKSSECLSHFRCNVGIFSCCCRMTCAANNMKLSFVIVRRDFHAGEGTVHT